MVFVYCIAPGLDMRAGSEDDWIALSAKLDQVKDENASQIIIIIIIIIVFSSFGT